mgnify:CR=1 FL=1
MDGARRVFAEYGVRKATMADVATRGGLAKATLYNHVRNKDELVVALVLEDVSSLAEDCADLAGSDLAVALTRAADGVASHPVLVGLRQIEPAVLAAAASPTESTTWQQVRGHVSQVLAAAGRASEAEHVDLVLRWLSTFAVQPGHADARQAQARLVAAGLPQAVRTTTFAAPPA